MIAAQVMANDMAAAVGGASGYLEMNVYKPLLTRFEGRSGVNGHSAHHGLAPPQPHYSHRQKSLSQGPLWRDAARLIRPEK
jgi:hypothetical protein